MTAMDVLREFVDTINATGGVVKRMGYAPNADEDWLDLGLAYMNACRVLNVEPKIAEEV